MQVLGGIAHVFQELAAQGEESLPEEPVLRLAHVLSLGCGEEFGLGERSLGHS
jgi:hypothetical protein